MLVCAALLCPAGSAKPTDNVKDGGQMISLYFTMEKKGVWIQSNASVWGRELGTKGVCLGLRRRAISDWQHDVRCQMRQGATAGTETGPRRRTADSTRLSGPAEGDASCPPKNSPCGELSVSELLQDASSLTKGLRAPTRQRCDVEQSRSALQLLAVGLTLGPSQCPRASLETRDQQADAGVRELAHRETRRID